jgi:hypothetical protein
LHYKKIQDSENIDDSDGDQVFTVKDGLVLFTWGRGESGCLGFGDEEDLKAPTVHPLFRDDSGIDVRNSERK